MDEKAFIMLASMQIAAANPKMTPKKVVDLAEDIWDELSDRDYDEE